MKLSICIATYNGSNFIDQQLLSIIPQLEEGDEVLVSDDGSSDNTVAKVLAFGGSVRVVSAERVGSIVHNFQRALSLAVNEGIVLCDQDDVWLPGRLSVIRKSLNRADLVMLNGEIVDRDLFLKGETVFDKVGVRSGFFQNLFKNSYVGCCMAFRRSLLRRALPFPEDLPWHDWYIGLLAEATGKIERVNFISILYRRHEANFSHTGNKSNNSFMQMIKIRYRVLKAVLVAVSRSG